MLITRLICIQSRLCSNGARSPEATNISEGKRRNEFAEWYVAWLAEWHNYVECNICRMTQRNKLNWKVRPFLAPINLQTQPLFQCWHTMTIKEPRKPTAGGEGRVWILAIKCVFCSFFSPFLYYRFSIFSQSTHTLTQTRKVRRHGERPKGDREQFASLDFWITD